MYCKNCGAKLGEQDLFCTKCGQKIGLENEVTQIPESIIEEACEPKEQKQENPVYQKNEATPRKENTALIVIILIVFLVVSVVVAFIAIPKLVGNKEAGGTSLNEKPNVEQGINVNSTFVYDDETGKTVHFNVPSTLKEDEYSDYTEKVYVKVIDKYELEVAKLTIINASSTTFFNELDKFVDEEYKTDSDYTNIKVTDLKKNKINGNTFKYKNVIYKYDDAEYIELYAVYEIDNENIFVLYADYTYLTDEEIDELLTITVGHLDNVSKDKAPAGNNSYIFNDETGEKVYFKLPTTLLVDKEDTEYDHKFVTKKIDNSYKKNIAYIRFNEQSVTEYMDYKKDYISKYYNQTYGYKNVELSEVQTKVVNGIEFKYITLKYDLYNQYYEMFAVTDLGNNTLYVTEISNVDLLTESEIEDLLTITVVK